MQFVKGSQDMGLIKKGTAIIGRTTDATGLTVANGSPIPILETVASNDSLNISILSTTQFRLQPGRKYRISVFPHLYISATDWAKLQLYDITAGTYVGLDNEQLSQPAAANAAGGLTVIAEVTPLVATTYEIRNKNASYTITSLFYGSKVIIEEVEASVVTATQIGILDSGFTASGYYEKRGNHTLYQRGWGYIAGTGSLYASVSQAFPKSFANQSIDVFVSAIGRKAASAPTSRNDIDAADHNAWTASARGRTENAVTVEVAAATTWTGNVLYSWEAIGEW